MSTREAHRSTFGTERQTYSLEKEDLHRLEEKGVEVDIPESVESIEVLYTENGDGYTTLSIIAEKPIADKNYLQDFLPENYYSLDSMSETQIAQHSGYPHEDDIKWGEIQEELQQLDGE